MKKEKKKTGAKNQNAELEPGEEYNLRTEKAPDESKKDSYAVLNIDDKMKQELADLGVEQIELAENDPERKEFLDLMDYCKKRYKMEDLDTEWPWPGASKRRTGDTTIAIDRMMPKVKRALLNSGHIVSVIPVGDNTIDNAIKQEKWLDHILREEMKLKEKFPKVLYDSLMLNFGVLKNPWERNEKVKTVKVVYESAEELLRNYPDAIEKYPDLILKLTGYEDIKQLQADHPDMKDLPKAEKIYVTESYREVDEGQRPHWVDPKNIFFPPGTKDEDNSWFTAEKLESVRADEAFKERGERVL